MLKYTKVVLKTQKFSLTHKSDVKYSKVIPNGPKFGGWLQR